MGSTPEGMGCHILSSVKMTLNAGRLLVQELICFSAFLYQYIEFFVFLKVSRRGGYSPPSPSKSATGMENNDMIEISSFSSYDDVEVMQQ